MKKIIIFSILCCIILISALPAFCENSGVLLERAESKSLTAVQKNITAPAASKALSPTQIVPPNSPTKPVEKASLPAKAAEKLSPAETIPITAAPSQKLSPAEAKALALPQKTALAKSAMCEAIEAYAPKNEAVVFSASIEKLLCFNLFDPVAQESVIYHKWYIRDKLNAERKLIIKPPRWSTFSAIQLRDADKGPWRVDIMDQDGKILKTLRFSVTD